MAAACFGIVYIFFTISLISLGMLISPLIKIITKLAIKLSSIFREKPFRQRFELAPIEWPLIFLSIFAIFFIFILGGNEPTAYWNLPLVSITLYLLYSAYQSNGSKLNKLILLESAAIHTNEKDKIHEIGCPNNIRKNQMLIITAMFAIPLLIGGVSGQLLDAAMRAAHVRVDNSIIYVKEPYSSLIPAHFEIASDGIPDGYKKFRGILISFKGFGKTTVINFTENKKTRKLEIPNESLIAEEL
ncbi:hypothetical protein ACSZME_08475 [Aeromonas dhakensis]